MPARTASIIALAESAADTDPELARPTTEAARPAWQGGAHACGRLI
jgi:hypothetical protein